MYVARKGSRLYNEWRMEKSVNYIKYDQMTKFMRNIYKKAMRCLWIKVVCLQICFYNKW